MKTRLIISAMLYIASLFGLAVLVGLLTTHCHQYYGEVSGAPIECSGAQGGATGILVNVIGFALLFGVAGIIAGLYYRFGWPKK